MDKYELVLIVDAALQQEEKESIHKQAGDIVTKNGGKIINSQIWLEKHKLAFKIKRVTEGTYYLIAFESERANILPMRQLLKINEKIVRFAIIRSEVV